MKIEMKNNFAHNVNYNTFRTFRRLIKDEAKDICDNFHFHLSLSVKIFADVDGVHQTSLFSVFDNDEFFTDEKISQKPSESKTSLEV